LQANGGIFRPQGAAIYAVAADDVRVLVLVLGKPANTNALIAAAHAPDAPADRFTAMMRLDHNRALTQIAKRLDLPVSDIHRMTIWGNHSASQYPDLYHARANGRSVAEQVDEAWLRETPIPTRGQTAVRVPGHIDQRHVADRSRPEDRPVLPRERIDASIAEMAEERARSPNSAS
jgi:malate/lactate dehydrogenase